MANPTEEDGFGCSRCGSFTNWEILNFLRAWQEGEKKFFAYQAVCRKCGRIAEWVTNDEDAVPERTKLRDELLKPDFKFDPKKVADSDLYGFDPSKLEPRLATGNQ